MGAMKVDVRPAAVSRFDDVAVMLGPKNPTSSVCWCLSHRVDSKTNKALVGEARGAYVQKLCHRKIAPGVLAYEGDEVVGWAPERPHRQVVDVRDEPGALERQLRPGGDRRVRVRPGHRGQGIAPQLVEGAAEYARSEGAPTVEGYPVDNGGRKVDLTMAFVGTRSMFETAGFTAVADTRAVAGGFPRILMRRSLT